MDLEQTLDALSRAQNALIVIEEHQRWLTKDEVMRLRRESALHHWHVAKKRLKQRKKFLEKFLERAIDG